MEKLCKKCGKEFKNKFKNSKFCSRQCYWKNLNGKISPMKGKKGILKSNSGSFKKYLTPWNAGTRKKSNCTKCSKEFLIFKTNQRFCSKGCATSHRLRGRRASLESRRKMSFSKGGDGNLDGFRKSLNALLRRSVDWKIWRAAVFERDNYTCQECRASGTYLEPHHIIAVKKCIKDGDLKTIFDINNGLTLCRKCHRKKHRKTGGD